MIATLANRGEMPALQLIQEPSKGCDFESPSDDRQIIPADLTEQLIDTLPHFDQTVGLNGQALAGSDRIQNWFLGLNSERVPRYAVAVLVSQEKAGDQALKIGEELLQHVVNRPETNP
jgi:hypothetical protein